MFAMLFNAAKEYIREKKCLEKCFIKKIKEKDSKKEESEDD